MTFLDDTPRIELFRIAGIPIKVDITFALVPIFLFGILQQAPLATSLPVFGILIAGVFLSVLLHELGHAILARLNGVSVGEILVGGFYGYARLLDVPRSTLANVIILLAGPLANGAIFLALWSILGKPAVTPNGGLFGLTPMPFLKEHAWLIPACVMLARINLAMLIFNLLPAFPLDGGRIYRDLIATMSSRATAAKLIAALGVVVGVWSAIAALRTDVVLLLIGAQIAIINWAIFKNPAEGESY